MPHSDALTTISEGFELPVRTEDFPSRLLIHRTVDGRGFQSSSSSEGESPEVQSGEDSLGEIAETERDYVRRRLRDELKREPSEGEVDEWLRRHTEGY